MRLANTIDSQLNEQTHHLHARDLVFGSENQSLAWGPGSRCWLRTSCQALGAVANSSFQQVSQRQKCLNPGRARRCSSVRPLEQRLNALFLGNSQSTESHRQAHLTPFPGTGAAPAGSGLAPGNGGLAAAGPPSLGLPGLGRAALLAAFAAGFLHGVGFGLLAAGLLHAAVAALLAMAVVPAIAVGAESLT